MKRPLNELLAEAEFEPEPADSANPQKSTESVADSDQGEPSRISGSEAVAGQSRAKSGVPSARGNRPLWRFLGRVRLSPLSKPVAEKCYAELKQHLRGKPPREVILGLWRGLAGLYPQLGGAGFSTNLSYDNTDRIKWEVACLLIDRINDQIARAHDAGGAWRAAIDEGVPDDLGPNWSSDLGVRPLPDGESGGGQAQTTMGF